MSYPTFQDKYGAGAPEGMKTVTPDGAGGSPPPTAAEGQPQQDANPYRQALDPWALVAQNEQLATAKGGAKV